MFPVDCVRLNHVKIDNTINLFMTMNYERVLIIGFSPAWGRYLISAVAKPEKNRLKRFRLNFRLDIL